MNVFEFVVIVVAITTVGGIIMQAMKMSADKAKDRALHGAANEASAAEMQQLKERIRVLEKLATDDDRRLAGEIERLRDPTRPGV